MDQNIENTQADLSALGAESTDEYGLNQEAQLAVQLDEKQVKGLLKNYGDVVKEYKMMEPQFGPRNEAHAKRMYEAEGRINGMKAVLKSMGLEDKTIKVDARIEKQLTK